ncbi:MAG: radical SAM protein [Acidobacteriota bacterium]|nr:radical SAM protein [Acidobacteriota bacterium]
MGYLPSRYNLTIADRDSQSLLFNCRTGSMVRIPAVLRPVIEALHVEAPFDLDRDVAPEARNLIAGLAEAKFFVDEELDELEAVKAGVAAGPEVRTLNLTILPTMGCNLRCTYCYQVRQGLVMREETLEALVREVEARAASSEIDGIEVDWFGGEPLLARGVIAELSARIREIAGRHGLAYRAVMATNGTLLDDATVELLAGVGVEEVQITLDGPPEVHDRTRPRADGAASFDAVVRGILAASRRLEVVVRINVDRHTVGDAWKVLDYLEQAGCFETGRSVQPYIAAIGPLSSVCSHTCDAMIPADEFLDHVLAFQEAVLKRCSGVDPAVILGVPRPVTRACGAHSELSMCVHPTGMIHKCGLEVHEPERAAGRVGEAYEEHPNYRKWVDLDPFADPTCARCRFLPLCLGGCPKYSRDPDSPYHREACLYFHRYLESTLRLYATTGARPLPS